MFPQAVRAVSIAAHRLRHTHATPTIHGKIGRTHVHPSDGLVFVGPVSPQTQESLLMHEHARMTSSDGAVANVPESTKFVGFAEMTASTAWTRTRVVLYKIARWEEDFDGWPRGGGGARGAHGLFVGFARGYG